MGPGAQTEEQVLPGAGAALAVRASGPYTAPAPRCGLESLPPLRPQSSQQAVDAFELGQIQLQGSHCDPKKGAGEGSHRTHTRARHPPQPDHEGQGHAH